ncbi:MAG: amidohydrolase family protein [Alphaproteobacteria bacterium]
MPNFPIVDAHVLLADPEHFEMPPLAAGFWDERTGELARPLGLAEYRAATDGLDVSGLVFLQVGVAPAYGLLEARRAADLARAEPRLAAIVAWAPVAYGARARAYLEALTAIDPRVVGVRHVLENEPAGFGLAPAFVDGVRLLAEFGLSFELGVKGRQLPDAIELVRRCPETAFVLGHIGKPDITGDWRGWREDVAALAAFPNVSCKVSGVVTEADHGRWTERDIAPPIERALEVFGEDRVMFGSDWPIVLLAGGYRRWVEALDRILAPRSDAARRKLWADNARRFYRMAPR